MIRTVDRFDARIYTSKYRAYGTIYLEPEQSTVSLLNSEDRHLLPVTDPLIYSAGTDHPPQQKDLKVSAGFLALHHDRIDWIVGGRTPERPSGVRRMAFLYDGHVLVGQVEVAEQIRSSDFLETAANFQTLFDAELFPWQAPSGRFLLLGRDMRSLFEVGALKEGDGSVVTLEASEHFEFVTVNLRRVTGVLEAPKASEESARSEALN